MNDPRYLIRKIGTCDKCYGDGFYPDPDWQALISAHAEATQGKGVQETLTDWERRIKEKWPYSEPPPEEAWCEECEGEGTKERWIGLREALQELGVQPLATGISESSNP